MLSSLPESTIITTGTWATVFNAAHDPPQIMDRVWLPAKRTVTLCHMAADQDGWEGEVIAKDPMRGGTYRLAIPFSCLLIGDSRKTGSR